MCYEEFKDNLLAEHNFLPVCKAIRIKMNNIPKGLLKFGIVSQLFNRPLGGVFPELTA